MGRKCAVPHCYTGYRKCKEKASLYRVPDDDFFLSKWQEAIAREDRPITPKDYVCEKHFKDDDILRRRIIKDVVEEYQRPRLKPDAIPSIFPDLPEFILKMVKKRRKMPLEESKSTEICDISENDKIQLRVTDTVNELNIVKEVKIEPEEPSETENLANTTCVILSNELDIKSESEDSTDHLIVKDGECEQEDFNFGPKMHRCDQCDYQTIYPHNLRTHKTKHRTGEEAYMHCKHCPNFKTKWELTYRNHLKIKHGIGKQEIFKCTHCSFESKVKLCLKRHLERHKKILPTANFSCDFPGCDFQNDNKGVLDMHKLSHIPKETLGTSKNFKCPDCLFETDSKTHIVKHIRGVHSAGDDTTVSITTQKKKKRSKEFMTREAPYKCLKCSYRSNSQGNLLKHVFKHNYPNVVSTMPKSKVWKCTRCPFATFFQHALQRHQETGCGNCFTCKECSFKSSYKADFIKHSLTHRNVTVESVNQQPTMGKNTELHHKSLKQSNEPEKIKKELEEETNSNTLENNDATPEFVTVKAEVPEDAD